MYKLKLIRKGRKGEESAYLDHKRNDFIRPSHFFSTLSLPPAVCLCPHSQPTSVCQNTVSANLPTCRLAEARGLWLASGPNCLQSLVAYIFSPELWLRELDVKQRTSSERSAICDQIRLRLCARFIGLKDHFCSYSGWIMDGEDLMNQNVKDIWGIVLRCSIFQHLTDGIIRAGWDYVLQKCSQKARTSQSERNKATIPTLNYENQWYYFYSSLRILLSDLKEKKEASDCLLQSMTLTLGRSKSNGIISSNNP